MLWQMVMRTTVTAVRITGAARLAFQSSLPKHTAIMQKIPLPLLGFWKTLVTKNSLGRAKFQILFIAKCSTNGWQDYLCPACVTLDQVEVGVIRKVVNKDYQGIIIPFNSNFWGCISLFRRKTRTVWTCIDHKLEFCQSTDWWLADSISVSSLKQRDFK